MIPICFPTLAFAPRTGAGQRGAGERAACALKAVEDVMNLHLLDPLGAKVRGDRYTETGMAAINL